MKTDTKARVCCYLNFPGNFKSEFNGGIQRFGDLPADANHTPVDEAVKKMGFTVIQGNNMHISLEPKTRAEAKEII